MQVHRIPVTVDLVILTVRGHQLCALVWQREAEPYSARWALAGGFIRLEEDLSAAAARVLAQRAGLEGAPVHLEQLQTYGYPDRDPRQRVVSVAYLGIAPNLPAPTLAQMSWQHVSSLAASAVMAFDHARILRDGVERARAKLEYTTLGAAFCPDEFTVAELRRVYEIVWGTPLDPRNFCPPVRLPPATVAGLHVFTGVGPRNCSTRRCSDPADAEVGLRPPEAVATQDP
jgi:8-oxo-dGTP diphosphatase